MCLSSAESELVAPTVCATEALGAQSFLAYVGHRVFSDATGALGLVRRCGLGRVPHLAVSDLWMQAKLADGTLEVAKTPGS